MNILGQRLKTLRKKTQVETACDLGLKYSTYAMYETGRREPDLETLVRMAEYFNVTVDWLLGHQTLEEKVYEKLFEEKLLLLRMEVSEAFNRVFEPSA